jgi:hypothetical protein
MLGSALTREAGTSRVVLSNPQRRPLRENAEGAPKPRTASVPS